jgi:hypothetical protein
LALPKTAQDQAISANCAYVIRLQQRTIRRNPVDDAMQQQIGIRVPFEKTDPEGKWVAGWASVVSKDGKAVEDHQGDVITIEDLRSAAHQFMADQRVAKAMHQGLAVGEVVESVIVDDAFVKAVGATTANRGWWIGMAIYDETIQKSVRDGTLRAFSIGGTGKREQQP